MHGFTSRNRALGGGVVAALTALTLSATADAASGGLPGPPAADAGAAKQGQRVVSGAGNNRALERQAALLPVAERLNKKAKAGDSEIAGVRLDADAGVLHVYTTDTTTARDAAGSVPAGTELRVHGAAFSRGEMMAALARVRDDGKALGQQRIGVAGMGPNEDGSGITITVVGDDADRVAAARVLRARYGDVVADVRAVAHAPSSGDLFFAGFRFNDYAPWYGGDRLASSSGGCTSGMAATVNSAPAVLTAAHCGSYGTGFYNGPRSNNAFNWMGSMNYDDDNADVAAIGVTSTSNNINVGGDPQVPSQRYIGSWGSPVVGQYMCQSGSYTGERCNLRVVATYQFICRTYNNGCLAWWYPMTDAINNAGSAYAAAGYGDSGGPIYLQGTSTGMGLVHGTLSPSSAARFPAYSPVNVWCPSPEGWQQRCSSGFSFAHLPGR